jgi:hypothetical protein
MNAFPSEGYPHDLEFRAVIGIFVNITALAELSEFESSHHIILLKYSMAQTLNRSCIGPLGSSTGITVGLWPQCRNQFDH